MNPNYNKIKLLANAYLLSKKNCIIIFSTYKRIDYFIQRYAKELFFDLNYSFNKQNRTFTSINGSQIKFSTPEIEKIKGITLNDYWIDEEVSLPKHFKEEINAILSRQF